MGNKPLDNLGELIELTNSLLSKEQRDQAEKFMEELEEKLGSLSEMSLSPKFIVMGKVAYEKLARYNLLRYGRAFLPYKYRGIDIVLVPDYEGYEVVPSAPEAITYIDRLN